MQLLCCNNVNKKKSDLTMQMVVFFRVHNTQGKPGKSRENLGKLENQGKSRKHWEIFWKIKALREN